ncbi:MAG: FAD binding domain-containing protein [Betaproteobacteria bacterium]|nr:FAD binding domain-containing protein [Betaproteobacteria bacterium]
MKPYKFEYFRPASLEEALDLLARHSEDVRILAGGQSLVPMMNFRLVQPKRLMDITALKSLDYIRAERDTVEVGATTTQAKLLEWPQLASTVPLVAMALPHVGHFQTRSRGTVCGSVAHSDPVSELPLCLAVLGGSVILSSKKTGSREVSAADFQLGLLLTARRYDEMVTAVRFPVRQPGTGYAFQEMAERKGDLAVCAVAAKVSDRGIRLGVGGVAEKPTVRDWNDLPDSGLDEALNAFAWDLEGSDDIHGSAVYRRQLVRRLGRRAIMEARECRK